jgi:hypothetical protein
VAALAVTRYAALTRWRAAALLALLLAATGWLLLGARGAQAPTEHVPVATKDESDVAFYKAVIARMRAGQGYYDAAEAELRGRGYPMRPAFSWRQPTYAWLLSRAPHPLVGNALLVLLGVAVVLTGARWVRRTDFAPRSLVAVLLLTLTMASSLIPSSIYLQEFWAGALIGLSMFLFALDLWPAAVAASFAALAFREFALLPCGVGLCFALSRRRFREVAVWVAGLALYAVLMSWHVAAVARHLRPGDLGQGFPLKGGSTFILATCQWSGLFVALPKWAVALVLPFVVLGLFGWRDAGALRVALVLCGYLAAFAVVGRAYNDYWGAIFAPLLPVGFIALPESLRDLRRALTVASPAGSVPWRARP